MTGKAIRRRFRAFPIALAIASCSSPTGAADSIPVAGSFVTEVRSPPRNPDWTVFDPDIAAVGYAGQLEITGFIPFDLCRQTLSGEFTRVRQDLVVTLNNPWRPDAGSRTCLQWVAETRYQATLTGLQGGEYRVIVIQNPARRMVNGQQVARVDTVVVGAVTIAPSQ